MPRPNARNGPQRKGLAGSRRISMVHWPPSPGYAERDRSRRRDLTPPATYNGPSPTHRAGTARCGAARQDTACDTCKDHR
ncbi:hypothetical protein G6F24_018750 [Rhizopus arrhizus]|nr:hypothetical protein G6F24_018750 [Rhizopus arrhizus]